MSSTTVESEAYEFIKTWKPKSDVYAFTYGSNVLLASTTASAMYINTVFRNALKLRNFAFLVTYGAAVLIPGVFSIFIHDQFVIKGMLHGRQQRCSVCYNSRSAISQGTCAVLYPMALAPLACFHFADRYMTSAVPSITGQPVALLKRTLSILRPRRTQLALLLAVNMLVGAGVNYWEQSSLNTITEKVLAMEQHLEQRFNTQKLDRMKNKTQMELEDEYLKAEKRPRKYGIAFFD